MRKLSMLMITVLSAILMCRKSMFICRFITAPSEEVLSKGAGHLQILPCLSAGASTHSVISAHSGYPGETFFDYLTDMKVGDEFYVHILDRTLKYEVDQIEVVLPSEINSLRIVDGEDLVTLLTCTPYGINTHRLLVRGKRVDYDDTKYN